MIQEQNLTLDPKWSEIATANGLEVGLTFAWSSPCTSQGHDTDALVVPVPDGVEDGCTGVQAFTSSGIVSPAHPPA